MRVLLLAGTAEAREIARMLAEDSRFRVTASLAGATPRPVDLGVETRMGGFGGGAGLADYIAGQGVELLVNATHPFAATMTAHAAAQSIPTCHVIRPPWSPEAGDCWVDCRTPDEAATRLPKDARAFLALGRQRLDAFRRHPAAMLVRSLAPPEQQEQPEQPDSFQWLTGAPGDAAAETALLRDHRITHLVCRNSGGEAGRGKLTAARALSLPVLMLRRPPPPTPPTPGDVAHTAAEAVAWCRKAASG